MTLVATYHCIFAFQIDPVIGIFFNYAINLTDALNISRFTTVSIDSGVIINDLLFILTDDF